VTVFGAVDSVSVVGVKSGGRTIPPHVAVGERVDDLGGLHDAAFVQDRDRSARSRGVVPERDLLVDEGGVHLVDDAMQTHTAILVDPALGFEEEEIVEIEIGTVANLVCRLGPAVGRRVAVESAVRSEVILSLDPCPEAAVERVETAHVLRAQVRQKLHSCCPKEPLLLSLRLGVVSASVDQRHPELRADQGDVLGAVRGTVVNE
jgi:hypothetical protein